MRTCRIAVLLTFIFLIVASPVYADRGLVIDAVNLNGFSVNTISVKPGSRIFGTLLISTSSPSFFRTHTGVWLPSWDKRQESMKVFLNSVGGSDQTNVDIDIAAPSAPGTYYLLFCFDRKRASEMFNEITLRTDETIFSNGRAIKVIVAPNAVEPPKPNTRDRALELLIDGANGSGNAGYGSENESWWKIQTAGTSFALGEGLLITLNGMNAAADLDVEVQDANGRRLGWSENEGSKLESSVVRVKPGEIIYVRVFGFKQGEVSGYTISTKKINISKSIVDPSNGKALRIGNGYKAVGRAGEGIAGSAWYSIAFSNEGSLKVEIRGTQTDKDIDLWIYDDLGNIRSVSREDGSGLERVSLDRVESGVYYIRVGAYKRIDESDFNIEVQAIGALSFGTQNKTISNSGVDSGQRCPVAFEVAKDSSFEGYIKVSNEASFLIEVFTGWGEIGKFNSIRVIAPDSAILWNVASKGRGWEAERVATRGSGMYLISISYDSEGTHKGRIDLNGLSDLNIYPVKKNELQLGSGGQGLDAVERETLQKLYELFDSRGAGISSEEAEILKRTEELLMKY